MVSRVENKTDASRELQLANRTAVYVDDETLALLKRARELASHDSLDEVLTTMPSEFINREEKKVTQRFAAAGVAALLISAC